MYCDVVDELFRDTWHLVLSPGKPNAKKAPKGSHQLEKKIFTAIFLLLQNLGVPRLGQWNPTDNPPQQFFLQIFLLVDGFLKYWKACFCSQRGSTQQLWTPDWRQLASNLVFWRIEKKILELVEVSLKKNIWTCLTLQTYRLSWSQSNNLWRPLLCWESHLYLS